MNYPPRKIINDPVHGFITVHNSLHHTLIAHATFQRLRRVQQMSLASLVYPGAVHTRLHHSLGAYHLMHIAIAELRDKGVVISPEEEEATKAAILLHDIGHTPFSHTLENILVQNISHETIGLEQMLLINKELNGALDLAIKIFTDKYPKKFLHQLISSQVDVDRMDYLSRDSFFTGVTEGIIGYDRILKMLVVHNNELMIEEKGIYSIEKFLIARRQMYWQVYLHKTVLAAGCMLSQIVRRVRELGVDKNLQTTADLDFFLLQKEKISLNKFVLEKLNSLDDNDIWYAIKKWAQHGDIILQKLCQGLLSRNLFAIQIQSQPFTTTVIENTKNVLRDKYHFSDYELSFFAFDGDATNAIYNPNEERVSILFKDGTVKNIAEVDNALINQTISAPIKKFYICQLR